MSDAPSQSQDKFIVRLPEGMREQIKAMADANKRSMNAQIVHALEFYFANEPVGENLPQPNDENSILIETSFDVDRVVASATKSYRKMLKESLLEAMRTASDATPVPELPEGYPPPFDPNESET